MPDSGSQGLAGEALPRADSVAWRAGFAVLLAGAMAMATSANSVFSVLAPFLLADLGIDRSTLGLLLSIVAGGGAATSLLIGSMADRWGGRRLLLAIFTAGAAVFGLTAASGGVLGLAVAAAICSLANGAANPATNNLIGVHLPPGRRGTVMGLKQSGVQAGMMLAGLLLPTAAVALGWRAAVALAGLIPVTMVVLTVVLVPGDPPPPRRSSGRAPRYRPSPAVWWMTAYGTLMGAAASALLGFVPLYAREDIGLSVQTAGLVATTVGGMGVAGRIAWSVASERLHDYVRPLGAISALSAVAATMTLLASPEAPWLLWAGAMLAGVSVMAWTSVGMLAVVGRVERGFTGRATGLVMFGFLSGHALGPAVFGRVVDATGSYELAWSGVVGVLVLATLTAVAWRLVERD